MCHLTDVCDDIISTWSETSEEHLQQLAESTTQRIEAVLKEKEGPTF